jgi:hypothetical protein
VDPYVLPTSFLNVATWDVLATAPQRIEWAFAELEPRHAPLFLAVTPLPGGRLGYGYENVAQAGQAARSASVGAAGHFRLRRASLRRPAH